MNRNQKAIEILRELAVWDVKKDGYPAVGIFYDRIAPLIRGEFPEEVITRLEEIIKDWHIKADSAKDKVAAHVRYICAEELERLVDYLQLLLEGGHIADSGKSVGLRPDAQDEKNKQASRGVALIEKPKGTCQTCRGSRKIHGGFSHGRPFVIDCPACEDTGECQHKNAEKADASLWCNDCHQYIKNRRIRKERRRWREERCFPIILAAGEELPFGGYIGHKEIDPPGWHEDRRTKDRRKGG